MSSYFITFISLGCYECRQFFVNYFGNDENFKHIETFMYLKLKFRDLFKRILMASRSLFRDPWIHPYLFNLSKLLT